MTNSYKRLVVISDLHLCADSSLGNFADKTGHALAALTQSLVEGASNTAFVLAGDIIDFLLIAPSRTSIDLGKDEMVGLASRAIRPLMEKKEWFRRWVGHMTDYCRNGGSIVLIPGNHDPEWFSQDFERAAKTILFGTPTYEGFEVHRASDTWTACIGNTHVKVLHGHTCDDYNDINRDNILAAIRNNQLTFPMPLGSQLVSGPIMSLKQKTANGQPRFPFIDAIKPEFPVALLFLLAIDPEEVLRQTKFLKEMPQLLLLAIPKAIHARQMTRKNYTLLGPNQADSGSGFAQDPVVQGMADLIVACLTESELDNSERLSANFRTFFDTPHSIFDRGNQSSHLGAGSAIARLLLKGWLHHQATEVATTGEKSNLSREDKNIINRFSATGVRHLLISGHTHAARHHQINELTEYINTGTWTGLFDVAQIKREGRVSVENLLLKLQENTLPLRRDTHYADVSEDCVKLASFELSDDIST